MSRSAGSTKRRGAAVTTLGATVPARGLLAISACGLLAISACGYRPIPTHEDAGARDGSVIEPTTCPLPHVALQRVVAPNGAYAVARTAETALSLHAVTGLPEAGAAALGRGDVRALVLAKPSPEPDPLAVLAAWKVTIERNVAPGRLVVRASGTAGQSAEGAPDVKEALWEITAVPRQRVGALRNWLLVQLAGRPITPLPPADGPESDAFVVKLTVVARKTGQVVVSAAIAPRDRHDQSGSPLRAIVDDLGNGTAVSTADRVLELTCQVTTIGADQRKADIIWVIDESSSTNNNRNAIIANAERFFAKAQAAGLDFRMGVTGMVDPKDGTPGTFCSKASTNKSDLGGADRFLSSAEKDTFAACVKNPPFRVSSHEYGLAGIYQAVARHLPRADRPNKIRPGASLVVIVVTDEAPQELKTGTAYDGQLGFLSSKDYKPKRGSVCNLSADKRTRIDKYLKPWLELLQQRADARARLHLIAGTCNSQCHAEVPYGYLALTRKLDGQSADLCQADLSATLQVIVDSILAGASPGRLSSRAVSASLLVEVDGQRLARSDNVGYSYDAAQNSLIFTNVKIGRGTRIVASFQRYVAP